MHEVRVYVLEERITARTPSSEGWRLSTELETWRAGDVDSFISNILLGPSVSSELNQPSTPI